VGFEINRSLSWIGQALNRIRNLQDTGPPSVVLDEIRPGLDVFGWERLEELQSFSTSGAAGADTVDPPIVAGWDLNATTGGGMVQQGVIRIIYAAQIQHNDPANLRVWIDRADHRGNPLGITYVKMPMDTGIATAVPSAHPVALARPILLSAGDSIRGRSQGIAAGQALALRCSWIDVQAGEYMPDL
jgi:hypothetical protein